MLGIIGAMEVEVEKLRAKMTETEMKTVAGMNFCRGKLEGKDVVIVRSGIGKRRYLQPDPCGSLSGGWNRKYRNRRFLKK